jgi:hypothetical protein
MISVLCATRRRSRNPTKKGVENTLVFSKKVLKESLRAKYSSVIYFHISSLPHINDAILTLLSVWSLHG